MEREIGSPRSFLAFANVTLSALFGLLFFLPFGMQNGPAGAVLAALFGTILGGAIGVRRRESRLFLYIASIGVLILAVLISFEGLASR